jgi:antirestriction protein ArdC
VGQGVFVSKHNKAISSRRIPMQKTSEKLNLYQIITDRIVASLEKGAIPWEKPWKSPRFAGGVFPRNFSTGKLSFC